MHEEKVITNEELLAIERRCNKASPGPWVSYIEGRDHDSGSSFIKTARNVGKDVDIELTGPTEADYDFIAAARQDVPKLIDEIRNLKQKVNEKS